MCLAKVDGKKFMENRGYIKIITCAFILYVAFAASCKDKDPKVIAENRDGMDRIKTMTADGYVQSYSYDAKKDL
jgi:hypothetical protein